MSSLGFPPRRTSPLEFLDEKDEPGDVGVLGEQGHDAVHLVRREDAAERDARPPARIHLAGSGGRRGARGSPEGAVAPAAFRPGRAAQERAGRRWERARVGGPSALGEHVTVRGPGAVPPARPELRAGRGLGAREAGQGCRGRRGPRRPPVRTARPGREACVPRGRPEEPRLVAEGEPREAAFERRHVGRRPRRGQAERAGLRGPRPGRGGNAPGAALLRPGRRRRHPHAPPPLRLRAGAPPSPRLRAKLVGHRQLRQVRPLRVVELALDAVGAFLAWKGRGRRRGRGETSEGRGCVGLGCGGRAVLLGRSSGPLQDWAGRGGEKCRGGGAGLDG